MKKFIAILLCSALIFTGCASPTEPLERINESSENIIEEFTESSDAVDSKDKMDEMEQSNLTNDISQADNIEENISFSGLDDINLLSYVENLVYENIIDELDSDDYFVEDVEVIYLSQEYLMESTYNSQSNMFFGYTLEELEKQFQGKRYVFTLSEDGQTTAIELEEVEDDTYDQIIKNVAVGSGVILVCVTVSVITANAAPAVSMIFAASATTGTVFALQSGTISFVATSIARGYQTHDFDAAIKAGTLAASEGFKWGAISGVIVGGVKEGGFLAKAARNGLSLNEAAIIQRESKWSLETIRSIHSKEEYEIYKNANLIPTQMEDGSWALLQEIDWTLVDSAGRTNAERVTRWNLAPIDSTGRSYELHHIGQKADGPLAILSYEDHHLNGNYKILHYSDEGKNVADAAWKVQREAFWKSVLKMSQGA